MPTEPVGKGYVEIGVKLDKLRSDMAQAKTITAEALSQMSRLRNRAFSFNVPGGGMAVKIPARDILNLESEKAAIGMRAAQHIERIKLQEELKDIRKAERDKVNAPKIAEAKAKKELELQERLEAKVEAARVRAEEKSFRAAERAAGLSEKQEANKADLFEKREARLANKRQEDAIRALTEGQGKQTDIWSGLLSGFGGGAFKAITGMGLGAAAGGAMAAKIAWNVFEEASDLNKAYEDLAVAAGRTGQKYAPLKREVEEEGLRLFALTGMSAKQAISLGAAAAYLKPLGISAAEGMETAAGITQFGGERDIGKAMAAIRNIPYGGNLSAFNLPTAPGLPAGKVLEYASAQGKKGMSKLQLAGGVTPEIMVEQAMGAWRSALGGGGRKLGEEISGAGLFETRSEYEQAIANVMGPSGNPAVPYKEANPMLFPPHGIINKTSGGGDDKYIEMGKVWLKLNKTLEENNEMTRINNQMMEGAK